MNIPLSTLGRSYALHQAAYEAAALRVLRRGRYILGPEVEAFEAEFAAFLGVRHAVGVNAGLDALTLALRALGVGAGAEVIVPANTYIATALAVTANGARPVFVEPDAFYHIDADRIEAAITDRTRAILAVHLYGQSANMEAIVRIAKAHDLALLEDCAQSHGARFAGKRTGTFGIMGCFSFYPTKNLGAFGDAGAIVTDDATLARELRMLRNYGSERKYEHEIIGVNSRLDELQAALLRVRLSHLGALTAERQKIAACYDEGIENPRIRRPRVRAGAEHVYHQYVIRTKRRDAFQAHLLAHGIETVIHYPIPPHLAACYRDLGLRRGSYPVAERYAGEVLSLPIFNGMRGEEIRYVIDAVNAYGGEGA